MEYRIQRASLHISDPTKPTAKAYLKDIVITQSRSYKSFEEYDEALKHKPYADAIADRWLNKGANHRIVYGPDNTTPIGIARDIGTEQVWHIRIETLGELMALVEEEGEVIVYDDNIIIYDSYVE